MQNTNLIAAAVAEIERPTFGATEQFLEVHRIAYKNQAPLVAGVTFSDSEVDSFAVVYFHVEDEAFYFAVWLNILPEPTIRSVNTCPWHRLYLATSSEELSQQQLAALTTLQSAESHDKGESTFYTFNSLDFEAPFEPAHFADKLDKLLDFLEEDIQGVRALAEQANGYIWATSIFHNGTGSLVGLDINSKQMRRLADLHLGIVFDVYALGNKLQ